MSELSSSITRGSSHSTSGSEGRGVAGSSPGSDVSASRKGARDRAAGSRPDAGGEHLQGSADQSDGDSDCGVTAEHEAKVPSGDESDHGGDECNSDHGGDDGASQRRTTEEAMGPTKARSQRKVPPRGRRTRADQIRRIPQRWIRWKRAAARRAAQFTRVRNGQWRRRDWVR